MKVLIIALTAARRTGVLADTTFLLEQGAQVDLLTVSARDWPDLPEGVRVLEIGHAEGLHPLPRVERLLVFRIPSAAFRVLRRGAVAVSGSPAPGTPAARLPAAVVAGERAWGLLARGVHNRGFMRFYRVVRPWVLWRAARTRVLPAVDVGSLDRVVVADPHGIPLGWHIARGHPHLPVTLGLDRNVLPTA